MFNPSMRDSGMVSHRREPECLGTSQKKCNFVTSNLFDNALNVLDETRFHVFVSDNNNIPKNSNLIANRRKNLKVAKEW